MSSKVDLYVALITGNYVIEILPTVLIIRASWSISESPGNNGSPVNISEKRHPRAQISTSGPYLQETAMCELIKKHQCFKGVTLQFRLMRFAVSLEFEPQNVYLCTFPLPYHQFRR